MQKVCCTTLLLLLVGFVGSTPAKPKEEKYPVKIPIFEKDVQETFLKEEDWFLPAGSQLRATIQNAIFSFNLVTPVIAILDEPAINPKNGLTVLPVKTRLLGTADILKSDDRVNIRFLLAVLPNGTEFEISGIALSPDGSAGIKGDKKEYKDTKLVTSAVGGAIAGVGTAVPLAMVGQPLAAHALSGALQQGAQQVQDISNQKVDVSISVPPFQKTLVFLNSRLSLDEQFVKAPSTEVSKDLQKPPEKKKDWKE